MKLRRLLALLTVCVLLCGMTPVSATAILQPLQNGGFEIGILSWENLSGAKITALAAREGRYGCQLAGDGDWDDLLCQTFTVTPDCTYTLRFWYKAQSMGVSWYLLDGGADGRRIRRDWAGETTWTQVVYEFTPTTDTVCLLYRGSGSHVAENVYLDCVEVTLNPCTIHTYDNLCDAVCNICDYVREIGDHVYDHDCDVYCNHCGFERPASGNHTYDYPCATQCNYCGALRVSEGEHTYTNVCDPDCNHCGEVRVPPHVYSYACDPSCNRCGEVRVPPHVYSYACDPDCNLCGQTRTVTHSYDDALDTACNVCGHVRVEQELFSFGGAAISYDVNGLSFRFFLAADDAHINLDYSYISRSATLHRYDDDNAYQLVRMGAVMSNEKDPTLDLEHLTGRTIDVKAGYLCEITEDALAFAIRIVNIPAQGYNTVIRARPYYVFSDGTTEIVVYGEAVSRTFNSLAEQA